MFILNKVYVNSGYENRNRSVYGIPVRAVINLQTKHACVLVLFFATLSLKPRQPRSMAISIVPSWINHGACHCLRDYSTPHKARHRPTEREAMRMYRVEEKFTSVSRTCWPGRRIATYTRMQHQQAGPYGPDYDVSDGSVVDLRWGAK